MTIIEVFSTAEFSSYWKATQYLLITTLILISPFLITSVAFAIIGIPVNMFDFIKHGEAGITVISILLWSGMLVARELKPPFAHRFFFQTLLLILGAFSIVIYTTVRIASVCDLSIEKISLCTASVTLLCFSSIFAWFVVLIDAVRECLDPQAERKNQVENLTDDFKGIKNE